MLSKRDEVIVRAMDIRKLLKEEVKLLFDLYLDDIKDDNKCSEEDYLEMLEIYKSLDNFIKVFNW